MNEKKCSIYDLAFDYVETFYKVDIPKEDKKQILLNIVDIVDNGWTTEEMYSHFNKFKLDNPDMTMDIKKYFATAQQKRSNLLGPVGFYLHNELRITTPPPIVHCDYNTGEFKKIVEPHFLEMRASYTVEDLYNYFLQKEFLYEKDTLTSNRMIGALKWLADSHDIDLLLFMIDTANDLIQTSGWRKLKNPMDIKDYYAEAKELWQRKLTESKAAGDDKIVPRKRMLFN